MLATFYRKESIKLERNYFGNKCLLKMNNGPGSSFKPIMLSSRVSDANIGWENLSMPSQSSYGNACRRYDSKTGSNLVKFYGGKELTTSWDLDISSREFSLTNYLIYSNNLFHSLIVFLGNYSSNDLLRSFRNDTVSIFKDFNPKLRHEMLFQNFYFGNRHYIINDMFWPYFGLPNT